jgi:hypothetical protein
MGGLVPRAGTYPKTEAGVRKVPIEPELLPLLVKRCEGLGRGDHVFPLSHLGRTGQRRFGFT